jgi:hypothetical protein
MEVIDMTWKEMMQALCEAQENGTVEEFASEFGVDEKTFFALLDEMRANKELDGECCSASDDISLAEYFAQRAGEELMPLDAEVSKVTLADFKADLEGSNATVRKILEGCPEYLRTGTFRRDNDRIRTY